MFINKHILYDYQLGFRKTYSIAQIQDDVARLKSRVTAKEQKLHGGQQPVSSEWGSALAVAARINDRGVSGGARQKIYSHVSAPSPCGGTHLMMVNFRGYPLT